MLKNCLRSLFVLLIPLLSFAQSAPLTYEDFVHLPEKEKDHFVIKTMELMVRLENNHRNDPRTLEITQDEEKKFTLFINQLKKQLFIPEAYAYPANPQADAEWKKAATEFKNLITKPSNEKKCVFAGWISKTIGHGKNAICAHPGFILGDKSKKNQTPEGRAYIAPSSGSTCDQAGQKMIQCNPVIFGYKSIKNKTPFCVSAENMARNSSFDCMQAARDLDANNKGDSKADRLNYLKDMLTQNKSVFKDVHEFNYKMCVCETKPIPDNFSKDYLNLIQLHQTCYGIMKMIGEVANSCKNITGILPQGMDETIFENLKNHIAAPSQNENDPVKNRYRIWYSDYITKLRKAPTPEYARLCGGNVAPPKPDPKEPNFTCTGKCDFNKPFQGQMNCSLTIKKDDKALSSQTKVFNMTEYSDDGFKTQKKELTIKPDGHSKDVSCLIDPPKTDIIVDPPKPDPKPDPQPDPKPDPEKKKKTYSCEATCNKDKEYGENGKICSLEITISEDGQAAKSVTIPAKHFTGTPKYKPEGEEKEIDCPEKKADEPNNDGKPTLEVTATEKDARSYNVKAVKTNDEGWSFSWVVKASSGSETPDVSKDWEDKTDTPPAGIQDDGTTTSTPSAKTEFVQKRAKVDFNICGQLKKGEETIEKCAPIKKYDEEKKPDTKPVSPYGQGNIPAPPQPMIRNSSDTGAVGVR